MKFLGIIKGNGFIIQTEYTTRSRRRVIWAVNSLSQIPIEQSWEFPNANTANLKAKATPKRSFNHRTKARDLPKIKNHEESL